MKFFREGETKGLLLYPYLTPHNEHIVDDCVVQ